MRQQELRRLAQIGAEARLEALHREIAAIHEVFPELRRVRSAAAPNPYTAGVRSAVEGAVTRRRSRRKLSREARQRIGDAQRKRWAEWKARNAYGGTAPKPKASGGARKKK